MKSVTTFSKQFWLECHDGFFFKMCFVSFSETTACYADQDDDIIFEDFARLRLKGETDAWNWKENFFPKTQTKMFQHCSKLARASMTIEEFYSQRQQKRSMDTLWNDKKALFTILQTRDKNKKCFSCPPKRPKKIAFMKKDDNDQCIDNERSILRKCWFCFFSALTGFLWIFGTSHFYYYTILPPLSNDVCPTIAFFVTSNMCSLVSSKLQQKKLLIYTPSSIFHS